MGTILPIIYSSVSHKPSVRASSWKIWWALQLGVTSAGLLKSQYKKWINFFCQGRWQTLAMGIQLEKEDSRYSPVCIFQQSLKIELVSLFKRELRERAKPVWQPMRMGSVKIITTGYLCCPRGSISDTRANTTATSRQGVWQQHCRDKHAEVRPWLLKIATGSQSCLCDQKLQTRAYKAGD